MNGRSSSAQLRSEIIELNPQELDAVRNREVKKLTWVGLLSNLFLSTLKFVGGIAGHSQALVADAVHSLSDISTDLVILFGLKIWSKPADSTHPHGHRRVETMATLFIGIVLVVVALGLLWNATESLREQTETQPGWIAIAIAAVSIVIKELLYRWTLATGLRVRSMPLIANAWHQRSDALSSLPVLIAVAGAAIDPAWAFLDSIGAFIVSFFILRVASKIVKPTLSKLLDSGAPDEDIEKIKKIVRETEGVKGLHNLRTRYLGCSNLAVDLHIEVDGGLTVRAGHDISEDVKNRLIAEGPQVFDVVVHLEPHGIPRA